MGLADGNSGCMTDDTREALAMITDIVDEVGAGFEGAFAAVDSHWPLADQVVLLHAEFSELTADARSHRFLVVMALLEGDQEMLEAARYYYPAAVLTWRRLLALPALSREDVLADWA